MEAYVGVDWSATQVVCATAVGESRVRGIQGASPTLENVRDLIRRVRDRHPEATEVVVIVEDGAPVWANLFHAAGARVYVVDPKQARKFSDSLCSSGAKDDKRDCVTLAELGRSPAHRPAQFRPDEPIVAQLHVLGAADCEASREFVRCQQQLRAVLRQYMPVVDQALKDVTSRWVIKFLRTFPTPAHFRGLDRVTFEEVLRGSGAHRVSRDVLWAAIEQTQAPWLDSATADIYSARIGGLLDRVELMSTQVTRIAELLNDTTAQFEGRALLESVDGIGPKLAAALLQYGFGSEVDHRDQAGIRMGACPVFKGSGTTTRGVAKGHASMRRAAHPRARRATYLIGRLAQQRLRWAAAMYAHGRAHGQNAATAYRRIARSLLRILTAMLRARH